MALGLAVGILFITMVLLITNAVRIDVVGLIALGLVGIFHLVPLGQMFSGFSSYAAIIIAAMFALGEALRQSGVTDMLANFLEKMGRRSETSLLTTLLVLPPAPSAFISDVGLMGIFLPTMIRLRNDLKVSLHRLLMPLAIAIALGGLLTMIGSAGNIIANADLASHHLTPLPLFAITPLGVILVAAGYLVMRWWGAAHLPATGSAAEFAADYAEVKSYMTEIWVRPDSRLIQTPLSDIEYFRQHHVSVVRVIHPDHTQVVSPGPRDTLGAGDRVVVQGDPDAIVGLSEDHGLEVVGAVADRIRLRQGDARVVELLIPSGSRLGRRTLRELNLRSRYDVGVLAVLRRGVTRTATLADIRLAAGDVLLVQGSDAAVGRLQLSDDVVVLAERDRPPVRAAWHPLLTTAVVLGVLALAAFNFLNIEVAAFAGVAVLVLARIVTPDQIYRAIDWRIIALIGGITPLSIALDHTGFTADVSHTMVAVLGPLGPYALAAAFYWLAALLTQVISNVAAALVLAPLALSIAHANAWSPYPLLIMMIVALSAAPLTPLANKVFLMAMGPGQYRYQDFIRVGGPVTLVMFTLSLVLVPLMFPFVVAH